MARNEDFRFETRCPLLGEADTGHCVGQMVSLVLHLKPGELDVALMRSVVGEIP